MHLDLQAAVSNGPSVEASSRTLAELIACLNSLHDGLSYANRLIAYGPAAIPRLREILIEGAPSGIPEPRQCAVLALARLGAYKVLLEYLRLNPCLEDTVVKQGEEAVQNTAARELAAAWQTDEAFAVLFDLVKANCLPGVVEALASFHRFEPAPYLIQYLEDDVCRQSCLTQSEPWVSSREHRAPLSSAHGST